jgi:uncharacterized phage infection (PIP) family protein YhgE
MKREHILAGIFLGLSLLRLPSLGQDASPAPNDATNAAAGAATNAASKAAAVAEQQGVDERFKQLAADIVALRDSNQLLLDKLSALKDDLQQIRTEQARLAASAIGRDDLKPLAQRIEEVDKKRVEDKEAISEEIKKFGARLEMLITNAVESASRPPARPGIAPAADTNNFTHIVQAGETMDSIRNAFNAEFKKKGMKTITLQRVIDANPGVDPKHLKPLQVIVIPHPPE